MSFLELTLQPAMDSINVDNDMLKDKIRSHNTLNTLHHEARQEIEILKKQLCKKDSLIADFKARLSKYERICINVEENEPVVIGPSKSLLESLCKEICKLKQKRNEAEVKASRQAEKSQQVSKNSCPVQDSLLPFCVHWAKSNCVPRSCGWLL